MNDTIALIDARIAELREEAQRMLLPYNAAIGELERLKKKLQEQEGEDA